MSRRVSARPVVGTVRLDRRTKDLVKRLQPGDVAVIDHRDLDPVAAEGLIAAGIAAVVNVSQSISGRYPNGGPIRLLRAGIPLLDRATPSPSTSSRRGRRSAWREGRSGAPRSS
ncbi:MAG: hypothetical protein M5U14_06420 [Acidimicrobiia bacterium]|nr:hypothetical protein [Acidimicrobiia bacterium]